MNIPNIITLSRIGLIPFFVLVFYAPVQYAPQIAAGIFFVMSVTDYIDGFLARKLNQSSENGAVLDLLADKLMVLIALMVLVEYYQDIWITLPAIIILTREIFVVHVRAIASGRFGSNNSLPVSFIGKCKTMLQMGAITLMLFAHKDSVLAYIGMILLYISVVTAVWSAVGYGRKFYSVLIAE